MHAPDPAMGHTPMSAVAMRAATLSASAMSFIALTALMALVSPAPPSFIVMAILPHFLSNSASLTDPFASSRSSCSAELWAAPWPTTAGPAGNGGRRRRGASPASPPPRRPRVAEGRATA